MIQEPWKLREFEPSQKLDARVRKKLRTAPRIPKSSPSAPPFFPLERTVYAVVLAVYAVYTVARAVQVFQEARVPHPVPHWASTEQSVDWA
ncbi:MAG: hypothetical protein ABW133_13455 [Polyangiaceae bacterium]